MGTNEKGDLFAWLEAEFEAFEALFADETPEPPARKAKFDAFLAKKIAEREAKKTPEAPDGGAK